MAKFYSLTFQFIHKNLIIDLNSLLFDLYKENCLKKISFLFFSIIFFDALYYKKLRISIKIIIIQEYYKKLHISVKIIVIQGCNYKFKSFILKIIN